MIGSIHLRCDGTYGKIESGFSMTTSSGIHASSSSSDRKLYTKAVD